MDLKKGDIFFIERKTALGRFINWAQRLLSADGEAIYNHSGIIISDDGQTLESLDTVRSHDFVSRYRGLNALVARPLAPHKVKSDAVDKVVAVDFGKKYPWYRFLILVLPFFAKYIDNGRSVCSELTAKYLYYAGVRHEFYQGTTPDKLVDEASHWKNYNVFFEGVV